MSNTRLRGTLAARAWFIAIYCCVNLAYGGSIDGWIRGTVTDHRTTTGIENVEVALVDANGTDTLQSKSDVWGAFVLSTIPPGIYELILRKQNFPEHRVRDVRVGTGCESAVDVQMEESGSNAQQAVIVEWQETTTHLLSCELNQFDRIRMGGLPSARNIWYLLQTQHPWSVTDGIDEGGMRTGVIQLTGVHAATWTQNSYHWDGFNITNPYEPGKPLTYPFLGMLEEFRIASGSEAPEITAAGADLQFTSRRGGGAFRGEAEVYYLGDPFQSSNLSDRLRNFGFTTTPHFKRFPEAEFSVGGSIPHRRQWSYFASFGTQHVSRVLPNFAATPITNIYSGLVRTDGRLGPRDQISGLASGQIVKNSQLGARPGIDPSSTLLGNDRFELLQGHWTHRHSDRSVSDLRFGFSHSSPTDTLQHSVTSPSYTQLFTGETRGAAPVESDSALSRFSLSAQTQFFRNAGDNGQHQIHIGGDLEESLATEELRVFNGLQLFLFPITTPQVAEFNSPSHAKQRLRELSFFAGDDLRLAGRIALHLALNLDSSKAFLPKQISGAGVFAPIRQFPGNPDVVSWTSLSPRVTVTTPLWNRPRAPRLTAGYSRYYHLLPAAYANYANPNALGGAVYLWLDRDQDRVFQAGEEGTLLRVFGGPFSSVDPILKRPFTDEWFFGLEHDAGRRIHMGVRVIERDSKRLVHTVNVGVPASAYTPVQVRDPGDDGILRTADDRVLTVFNQDTSTFGQDRYLLTNPAGLRTTYKGLESNITGRLAEQGFVSISFTAFKSVGDGNPGNSVLENDPTIVGTLFDNPNTQINSRGRLFFDRAYVAKVAAYVAIPLRFRLGSAVSYFDGLPFGRKLVIPSFSQGTFFVMATPRGAPGGFRTQYNLTFDQRVSRDFDLGARRLSVMLDIFNVLNLNKNLSESDLTSPLFVQRRPLDVQNPRAFRLGAKFTF